MLFDPNWGAPRKKISVHPGLLTQPNFASGWTVQRGTLTPRAGAPSPNGDNTAARFIEDNTTNTHNVFQQATFTVAAVPHRMSVFVRDISSNLAERQAYFQLYDSAFAGGVQFLMSLKTGLPLASTPSISYGVNFSNVYGRSVRHINGWYEMVMIFTPSVDTSLYWYIAPADNTGNNNYLGDNTSGFDVWGASLRVL